MLSRNVIVTISVIAFHGIAIWLLQTGLLRRTVEFVVPAEVIAEFIEPPHPTDAPPPPPPPEPKPLVKPPTIAHAPQLRAIPDPTPSPNAPVAVIEPPPPIAAPATPAPPAPPAPAAPPLASPAPPRVELPSSDADYLQNPKPPYPLMSKKLNEQGSVVTRVLIGADGAPEKAQIRKSSGFDRLDQSAATTVMKWRYVPGKRAGVAEAMWFNVPINFVLK